MGNNVNISRLHLVTVVILIRKRCIKRAHNKAEKMNNSTRNDSYTYIRFEKIFFLIFSYTSYTLVKYNNNAG